MSTELFAATMRPTIMVGQDENLNKLERSIFDKGDECRIVFVQGKGGQGKTRLIEEALCRLGHHSHIDYCKNSKIWVRPEQNVIALGLIDLMDINLHASQSFIDQLYIKFEELGHFFDSFYGKRQELQRLVQQGVDFLRVQKVVDEAVEAFFKDYRELANKSRIVLFVDTAEQLNAVVSEWLYTHKDAKGQPLLKEEDLRFQTQQWLAKQIEAGHFYNTTIVFAGRDEEGELFFERMNKAIKKAKGIVEIISMKPLKNFGLIKEFFQQLASDWKVRAEEETDQEEKQAAQQMTNNLDELVNSEDMVKVLWLFTGGRPVLLSLYADLLLEPAIGSPEPLLLSWKEAVETVGTDSIESPTLALRWQQWQVEEAFISLIFSSQGQSKTLYRDILQLLVRSPRGLTAEQIHFLLDNEDGIDIKDWEPDQRRLKEIKKVLERWLGRSSLLKVLQHGYRPKEDIYRLQDEIYRIYAEHMAPNKFPAKDVEELWEQHMSANQKKKYEKSFEFELNERKDLYERLHIWAKYHLEKLQKTQRKVLLEQERELERQLNVLRPTEARLLTLDRLDGNHPDERWKTYREVIEWSLEYIHYDLLLDFEVSFNRVYRDFADERTRGHDEDVTLIIQSEMQRLLDDKYAMKFVELDSRSPMRQRKETPLDVLYRVADQEDMIRWLKRFVSVYKDYDRAIEFVAAVEQAVANLENDNERESWQHTVARGERACWAEYAQMLKSKEIDEAIENLGEIVKELILLANSDKEKLVFKRGRIGENGFKGHPAETHLRRLISLIYNYMGYGHVSLRQYRLAIDCYGQALLYVRETGAKIHRAFVLNNLSRAESELGRRGRPLRLCRDALNLRREIGADLLLALSHSTLSLIYNDQNRPQDAWKEAAKAVAYARQIEETRVLGLALKHLGEALRRLANQEIRQAEATIRVLAHTPESLLDAAQDMLEEAEELFNPNGPAGSEKLRLIEIKIELGCVHRDRLLLWTDEYDAPKRRLALQRSLNFLNTASVMAAELQLIPLKVDALVNRAWAFYQFELVANGTKSAELIGEEINLGKAVEEAKNAIGVDPLAQKRILSYKDFEATEYYQLSKLANLEGRVALDKFQKRTDDIEKNYPGEKSKEERVKLVHHDNLANEYLDKAADAFVQASMYAQLYSSRSNVISVVYGVLYSYGIKFNLNELTDYIRKEEKYRKNYQADEIELEKFGIADFWRESFGVREDFLESRA